MADDYRFQVEFLRRIQQLLTEGGFVATYKYALLHAIADLCVETEIDEDGSLTLTVDQLAEKFIELYWPQVLRFPAAAAGEVLLKQNTGRQAAVVNAVSEFRGTYEGRLSALRARPDAWRNAVRRVGHTVQKMPLWKLQTIGTRPVEFLYRNDEGADRIRLLPGVPLCFRALHELLIELVRSSWIRFVRRHNDTVRDSLELYGFLFGSERSQLDAARKALRSIGEHVCFYCNRDLKGVSHVDHFIPWARYPNDLGHNFVLSHAGCNSAKSDSLAAEEHLERWVDRIHTLDPAMRESFEAHGIDHDRTATLRVARWAYGQTERAGGEVWVIGRSYRPLGNTWHGLFT